MAEMAVSTKKRINQITLDFGDWKEGDATKANSAHNISIPEEKKPPRDHWNKNGRSRLREICINLTVLKSFALKKYNKLKTEQTVYA